MKSCFSRRRFLGSSATVAAAAIGGRAFAQRAPVHLLVGYPAGGATDVVARLVARNMAGFDTVLVENRAGAGGRIAVEAVSSAKGDGQTLVVTPDFPLTVFPHLYSKLRYDPLKDLLPVAMCGTSELAFSVGPAVPKEVSTVGEFMDWARRNPKLAMYASPSPGSTPHFTGVMLAGAAKKDLTHVAYKGGAQAIQDLLGGQVPASINPVAEVLPHLASGRLRVLGTSGQARSRFLPDVLTFREAGYPGVVVQSWIGIFAPANTPEATLAVLEKSVSEALKTQALAEGFAKLGMSVASVPRHRLTAIVREDLHRWATVVAASGFKVDE